MSVELSTEEMHRYARHLTLPQVGAEGQRKLKAGSVLIIGTGGLGAPLALYLAAAGVGRIGLVDFDLVEISNLQRQVLFQEADIGRPKLEVARERILGINPNIKVVLHEVRLTAENALDILRDYDVIADGTDNFPTRYLVNDACVLLGKPDVYGSIYRFEGQASVFWATKGACYRCLYPNPPPPGLVPSCAEGGVLGVLPGIVGSIQATEVLKLLLDQGEPLIDRLLVIDTMRMEFRKMKVRKDPNCPICGEEPTQTGLIDYEEFCGVSKVPTEPGLEITVEDAHRLFEAEEITLLDIREPYELEIAQIQGTLNIPMAEVVDRLTEIPAGKDVVVLCRSGVRSASMTSVLRELGRTGTRNLRGGILVWAEKVDSTITKY